MKAIGFIKETLKPLEKYLKINGIVEIMINEPKKVIFEKTDGTITYKDDQDLTLTKLEATVKNLANYSGQKLDETHPVLSTYLPNYGYRFQAVMGSAIETGISISIRIGNIKVFSLEDYFVEKAKFVQNIIEEGKNILIAGGTSTGKTTCLNSLIQCIPKDKRIITLENMRELTVNQPNKVHLLNSESRGDEGYKILANSILRMRPDRIILGELTITLSKFFLRLANTGHAGSMTTIHADNPQKALDAVVRNLLLDGASDSALSDYVADTIDYVIQMKRASGRKISAGVYTTTFKKNQFHTEEI